MASAPFEKYVGVLRGSSTYEDYVVWCFDQLTALPGMGAGVLGGNRFLLDHGLQCGAWARPTRCVRKAHRANAWHRYADQCRRNVCSIDVARRATNAFLAVYPTYTIAFVVGQSGLFISSSWLFLVVPLLLGPYFLILLCGCFL